MLNAPFFPAFCPGSSPPGSAHLPWAEAHMVATLSTMEHAVAGGEVNGPKKDGPRGDARRYMVI